MTDSFSLPRSRRRGFTIIELLVAIGVTALLVTLMFNITINLLQGWNRTSGNLTASNQARFLLDQLAQDLEGSVMRRDNNVWFAASIQQDQAGAGDVGMTGVYASVWNAPGVKPSGAESLVIDPAVRTLDNYRFGKSGVWLRFFSVPADNSTADVNSASAPRAIAYQFVRNRIGNTTAATEFAYLMYRMEVAPAVSTGTGASTFDVGYDLFMPAAAISYNQGNGGTGHPGNIRRPNGNSVIANNVIDFGLRLFEPDATGTLVEVFPVDRRSGATPVRVFAATADTTARDPFNNTATHRFGYPTVAEIMVRILTPEGTRLINAYEADPTRFSGTTWWQLAEQHSQVFTRRVQLKSNPL